MSVEQTHDGGSDAGPDGVSAPAATVPLPPRAKFLEHDRVRVAQRRHVRLFNLFPFVVAVAWLVATAAGWVRGPSRCDLAVLLIGWAVTALCITVGFHRHFTHLAFEAAGGLRALLAVGGMMSAPGPVISWVATHRCHHQHSDDDGDPHSPHLSGGGLRGALAGLWHAHFGWMAEHRFPSPMFYAPDLLRDRLIVRLNRRYDLWVVLGLLIPGLVSLAVDREPFAFVSGVMWGGFIRLALFQQIASGVNSVCHVFGTRPYDTADGSRNNVLLVVGALGEGWHNNHHAFPTSAYFGTRWWQVDPGGIVIGLLARLGLVWNVRRPVAGGAVRRSARGGGGTGHRQEEYPDADAA